MGRPVSTISCARFAKQIVAPGGGRGRGGSERRVGTNRASMRRQCVFQRSHVGPDAARLQSGSRGMRTEPLRAASLARMLALGFFFFYFPFIQRRTFNRKNAGCVCVPKSTDGDERGRLPVSCIFQEAPRRGFAALHHTIRVSAATTGVIYI